jgi:hypothetical protein
MDMPLSHSQTAEFDTVMKFRRYFTTHPDPIFRKRYSGRLETLDFGDKVMDDAAATVRNAINERHDANWADIQPADDMTGIHLDYLRSTESNAFAFYVDDLACIAVTEEAVRTVLRIAQSMAISPSVMQLLGVRNPLDLSPLASSFFVTIMQILTCHEMGHIFHGHCYETARSLPLLEATRSDKPCWSHNVEQSMRLQAMEVEADGYSAHMIIGNLFDGVMGQSLAKFIATELPADEFILTFMLLAVAGLFYLWAPRTFDESRVEHCDHPFALMRMNVFMTDIQGWCENNHASLVNWGTVDRFQKIMGAAAASDAQNQIPREVWERQGAFMLSPDGDSYRTRLYRKREQLRTEMAPHQWHLRAEKKEGA